MRSASLWSILARAWDSFNEDKASRFGAVLAFYTVFSIAPLLVITIGIAGLVFGKARAEIIRQVTDLVGREGGEAVGTMVERASRPGSGGGGRALGIAM